MICRTAAVALLGAFADGERPTAVGSQDHETLPVRCHYEYADDAARCALVLDAVTDAWAAQVDRLGFHPPMPDADGILDLYLTDDGTYGGLHEAKEWDKVGAIWIDNNECIRCGACYMVCPTRCISITKNEMFYQDI